MTDPSLEGQASAPASPGAPLLTRPAALRHRKLHRRPVPAAPVWGAWPLRPPSRRPQPPPRGAPRAPAARRPSCRHIRPGTCPPGTASGRTRWLGPGTQSTAAPPVASGHTRRLCCPRRGSAWGAPAPPQPGTTVPAWGPGPRTDAHSQAGRLERLADHDPRGRDHDRRRVRRERRQRGGADADQSRPHRPRVDRPGRAQANRGPEPADARAGRARDRHPG